MKLSIAVPTFRRPEMLAECVDSLLPQLVDGVELIVIDNDPAESAKERVSAYAHPQLRYVPEPRPGVANARNRAVSESGARYLAFIDDDEIADHAWVAALLRHVERQVAASFGMVVPRFLGEVPRGLEQLLDDLYTRDLKRPQDGEVSDLWAHTGTGNSLFDKQTCLQGAEPFSQYLGGTGGEDVWLIQTLVQRGIPIHWNPAAIVWEQVPAERSTQAYVSSRRYRQGQVRTVLMLGDRRPSGWARAAFWMAAGAAQWGVHTARAAGFRMAGRPRWRTEAVRAQGGLGKVFWWKFWDKAPYGSA